MLVSVVTVLTVLGTFPVSGLWSSKKREKKEKGKRKNSSLPDGVPLLPWTKIWVVVDRHLPTPAHPGLANISGT